ncbi:MAG: nickel-responsive transcriptional regulator NikR [Rhodocyclaceae bacterium]|nr:nickel-responsive transcriptional regulator NikR [Rhodocyclaceae bacterium]
MERITISLDGDLATAFDALIAERGYRNRSEAMRDLLRAELERARGGRDDGAFCIAALSYVYNHHERELAERLTGIQHRHHDLTVSTLHAHLDHDNCLECTVLRGPSAEVRRFADALVAERGVRHGSLNLISAEVARGGHSHGEAPVYRRGGAGPHVHYRPRS